MAVPLSGTTAGFGPDATSGNRRDSFVREIRQWIKEREQKRENWAQSTGGRDDHDLLGLTREQLGAAKERLLLIKRALVDNVAEYYRANPAADRGVGVLVIDTLLADNDEGCSTVSGSRLGALLNCTEETIGVARRRNWQQGLLNREVREGFTHRYWPAIARFLGGRPVHPTWWLDATSPLPPPRGRPPKNPQVNTPEFSTHTFQAAPGGFSENPPAGAGKPPGERGDDFTTQFTKDSQGNEAEKRQKKSGELTAAEVQLSDEAIALWNTTASRLGLTQARCITVPRRRRLLRRLSDIGGLDQFREALSAIELVPFLMGKVPPKPGMAPFKLDIDRLVQTDGNLGDVLARLIDKAGAAEEDLVGPNGKKWGWWRGKEDRIRGMSLDGWRECDAIWKPNGVWPWWAMGPPPGHKECLMPKELIEEKGYLATYQKKTRNSET